MRPLHVVVCALLILNSPLPATAQQAAPVPLRNAQSLTTLQSALTALAGPNAIAQLSTSILTGSIVSASGANSPEGNFVWEDQLTSAGHEFRDSFSSSTLNQVFVSGHGTPAFVSNGHVRTCYSYVADYRLAAHLPTVALGAALQNSNVSVSQVGPSAVNGAAATQVHLEVDTDRISQIMSPQEWFFDATSGLPVRIEYRVPDNQNSLKFVNGAVELSDYRIVQGVLVPYRLQVYEDGKPLMVITISSVVFNQAIPSTDFDLPTAVAQ
jgi:hypothetical protein